MLIPWPVTYCNPSLGWVVTEVVSEHSFQNYYCTIYTFLPTNRRRQCPPQDLFVCTVHSQPVSRYWNLVMDASELSWITWWWPCTYVLRPRRWWCHGITLETTISGCQNLKSSHGMFLWIALHSSDLYLEVSEMEMKADGGLFIGWLYLKPCLGVVVDYLSCSVVSKVWVEEY